MANLAEHIAVSPISLVCSRCKAEPGQVCEIRDGEIELVHIERIKAAAAEDAAANRTQKK